MTKEGAWQGAHFTVLGLQQAEKSADSRGSISIQENLHNRCAREGLRGESGHTLPGVILQWSLTLHGALIKMPP